MVGVEARWVVALVPNLRTLFNRTIEVKHQSVSMNKEPYSLHAQHTISVLDTDPSPFPAAVILNILLIKEPPPQLVIVHIGSTRHDMVYRLTLTFVFSSVAFS